ncbi:hypothetical protein MTR_3g053090 [Medicago truncatula]|uniref:Uncharacterized protein n=1 Tax=Medicago truncatula TaxID=3880 RepID=A0A072UXT1_MEDTR|nr:hypothetical protein MTR_3g053090 [Medicago truncatula]
MQKSILPSSGSDDHQHCHRSERPSPDSTHREVEPPRPTKRKSDHHSEPEHDGIADRDYEHECHQYRRHHHRTKSSSKKSTDAVTNSTSRKSSKPNIKSKSRKSSEPVTKSLSMAAQATTTELAAAAAATDRKQKASVFINGSINRRH